MRKNYTINFFKIIATVFVVGIHCFEFYIVKRDIYILLMSLFSLAVPFFFVSSGYFMYINLNKKEDETDKVRYLKKYLIKLLLIYIVYIIIDGFLINFEHHHLLNEPFNLISWLFSKATLLGTHKGGYFYPIWFLLILIYSHIIIYFFKDNLKELTIISLIIYMVLSILQATGRIPVSRTVFTIGLFYTSLGYLLSENNDLILDYIKHKKNSYLTLIGLLLFILLFFEAYLIYIKSNILLSSYITLAPLTSILFVIFMKYPNLFKNNKIQGFSKNTFGIYLIHSFLLRTLYWTLKYLNIEQYFITNVLIFILFIIIMYFISYITYYGLFKTIRKMLFK